MFHVAELAQSHDSTWLNQIYFKTGRKESMERLQEMAGQGVLYVDTKHLTSNKMSGSSGAWELVFLCLYVCAHHRGNFGK